METGSNQFIKFLSSFNGEAFSSLTRLGAMGSKKIQEPARSFIGSLEKSAPTYLVNSFNYTSLFFKRVFTLQNAKLALQFTAGVVLLSVILDLVNRVARAALQLLGDLEPGFYLREAAEPLCSLSKNVSKGVSAVFSGALGYGHRGFSGLNGLGVTLLGWAIERLWAFDLPLDFDKVSQQEEKKEPISETVEQPLASTGPLTLTGVGMSNFEAVGGQPGSNLCWLNSAFQFLKAMPNLEERLEEREGDSVEWKELKLAIKAVTVELKESSVATLSKETHGRLLKAIQACKGDLLDGDDQVGIRMGDACSFLNKLLGKLYKERQEQIVWKSKVRGNLERVEYRKEEVSGIAYTVILNQEAPTLKEAFLQPVTNPKSAVFTLPVALPEVMTIRIDGQGVVAFNKNFEFALPLFGERDGKVVQLKTARYRILAAVCHECAHYTAVTRNSEGICMLANDAHVKQILPDRCKELFQGACYLLLQKVSEKTLVSPRVVSLMRNSQGELESRLAGLEGQLRSTLDRNQELRNRLEIACATQREAANALLKASAAL